MSNHTTPRRRKGAAPVAEIMSMRPDRAASNAYVVALAAAEAVESARAVLAAAERTSALAWSAYHATAPLFPVK